MDNPSLIIVLAVSTLLIVVGVLVYQRFSVSKAEKEHHHSAMTRGNPEMKNFVAAE